jgi:hypothetical protein
MDRIEMSTIHTLAADIASRVPDMAKDSPLNNQMLIERFLLECKGIGRIETDQDLPAINRTWANFWQLKYSEAMRELSKANKGIRRLRSRQSHPQPQDNRLETDWCPDWIAFFAVGFSLGCAFAIFLKTFNS